MPTKIGITNLTALLLFSIHLGNVTDRVSNHGTTWAEKFAGGMEMIPDAALLASVDFKMLKDEVSDLDEAEKGQLKQTIKDKFQIADHKLEFAIEEGIGLLLDLEGFIKRGSAFAQALKAA